MIRVDESDPVGGKNFSYNWIIICVYIYFWPDGRKEMKMRVYRKIFSCPLTPGRYNEMGKNYRSKKQ